MKPVIRYVIGIVVILILAAGAWSFVKSRRASGQETFKTVPVDRGVITQSVTATGSLSAFTTVQVGSQVSGVISALYADFNSPVKKGQLLAEIDPTPFQAQVEQKQAQLRKAVVDLQNAKINLTRQERLVAAGIVARADLDGFMAAYKSAQADRDLQQASLDQTLTSLKYTKIVSPIDGVVAERQYDVGQTVAASFQAPTLFTIAQDLTKMQLQADVDQSDIGRVEVGQLAHFNVDAYPEEDFTGKITEIRLNATENQNVITYPVIIQVPNPDLRLRPKMTANVTIDIATVRNALRIPSAALRFKPEDTDLKQPRNAAAGQNTSATAGGRGNTATASPEGGGGRRSGSGSRGGSVRGGRGGVRAINGAAQAPVATAVVYTTNEKGELQPVNIRTGISDGRVTEVLGGPLSAGDRVVTGKSTAKAAESTGRPPRVPGGGRF
ncbi:MAG: efflux RND transporter periplasmic adaptor subunit [Acidobacteriota bacterium]